MANVANTFSYQDQSRIELMCGANQIFYHDFACNSSDQVAKTIPLMSRIICSYSLLSKSIYLVHSLEQGLKLPLSIVPSQSSPFAIKVKCFNKTAHLPSMAVTGSARILKSKMSASSFSLLSVGVLIKSFISVWVKTVVIATINLNSFRIF